MKLDESSSCESISRLRTVFEEGITQMGAHMAEGSRVWELFRTFEQRLLDSTNSPDRRHAQTVILRKLYTRQLIIPLKGLFAAHDDAALRSDVARTRV